MANTITHKKSNVAGKVPATTDLALGELAVNTYDGKAFIKKNVGGTETVVEVGASANADTATKLATPRTINGASFDGSQNITTPATTSVIAQDLRTMDPVNVPTSKASFYFTTKEGLDTDTAGGTYSDFLALSTYSDASGGGLNGLLFPKNSQAIYHYQGAYGSAAWGTPKQLAYTDSNITGNAATATALAAARAINGVNFNGTANITVPATSGAYFGVTNVSNTSGHGLSLYGSYGGGQPSYGLMFAGTPTFGTHGAVTGDWATYLTMTGANTRGWIYRHAGANVASVSGTGVMTAAGFVGPLTGNASTATTATSAGTAANISNTGTVTLASATESNAITITAPTYSTDKPVKLLNFDWYGNTFSLGNIRSGATPSNGFGVYYTASGGAIAEIARFGVGGTFNSVGAITQAGNQVLHAGNYNTYAPTLTGVGASGSWPISVTGNAATATKLPSRGNYAATAPGNTRGELGLSLYAAYANGYPVTYGNVIHMTGGGSGQLLLGWSGTDGAHENNYIRSKRDNDTGAWSPWAKILTDINFNSHAPTLTGGGASGSWAISVTGSSASTTGNAATATALATARAINGVSFNGSADIAVGDLRGNNYISGGGEKPNSAIFGSGKFRYQMLNSSNLGAGTVGTWNDVLWVSSYTGGDVKGSNALIMSKEQDWIGFARQAYDSAAWGTVRTILHSGNYNSYSPTLTGGGASGDWNIRAYPRRADTGGVLNFYWQGQAGQPPWLWGGSDGADMYVYNPSNFNVAGAVNLTTNRTNWSSNGTISAVVGQLAWKNYNNNHTIFDASAGTSPDGTAVNNTNAQIAWAGSYPTLMGWNGANTYGVRVDSARISDVSSSVAAGGDGAITSQHNGNTGWMGRILSKNATSDKAAFLGTYGGIAGVFAHNNALTAWADLYVNTVDGASGGAVRLPAATYINSSQAIHAGNYGSYALPLAGGTMTGDIVFATDARDHSPMGTYDSTKTQQIWSMGAAYRNSATGVNFGTLYGAAYKHTNNATGGAMAGNHQFVWCQNGVGTAALGDGIWTSGNVTAYSDIRVKTNIEVIPHALHKVTQLSGYTFDRTDRPEVGRQTGVIAQEVLKVLPEAVSGDEEGKYSVAYGNLVGLLIESIKELNAKVETLEARLASTTQPN